MYTKVRSLLGGGGDVEFSELQRIIIIGGSRINQDYDKDMSKASLKF
jgi:hypothetical protein